MDLPVNFVQICLFMAVCFRGVRVKLWWWEMVLFLACVIERKR